VKYRLGIDIGVNSLGRCILRLDGDGRPSGIADLGVRLFQDGRDPQKGTSLAVDRRVARSMRRRRDRYLLRRADLMDALVRHGLMPTDEGERKRLESLDPYALRARGLDERLTPHELGRAVFHLGQRRGFKSNRKVDKADDKDAGKIKSAISRLRERMSAEGARTIGEYLHRRHELREPVRTRLQGEGAQAEYAFYPQRELIEDEFDRLWTKQTEFHPALTPAARDEIRSILFRQRPLRPVDPGRCTLDPSEQRAPAALPIAQDFRIWQELANLRTVEAGFKELGLTREQREKVYGELERKPKVTFDRMRRLLKLESSIRFNLESEKRDHLKGHETNVALAKLGRFGAAWWGLDQARRVAVVETLLAEPDPTRLIVTARSDWGLDEASAISVSDARLPEGYVRLGRSALSKVVPILRDQGLGYADAVLEAGYHHSDFRPGEQLDELPYYGKALERHVAFGTGDPADPEERRHGRIANPTVHIGLNQLRRLVNEAIDTYGPPAEIVVELARDLKRSLKEKQRIQKEQAANQGKNDQRRTKLAELGIPDGGENRLRLRLWEELAPEPHDRKCVYTGRPISISMLFNGEIDIDHVLPFRLTFDDSPANKIVCCVEANRRKARRTPFEAFGHTPEWQAILARAESLPKHKRWRFAADALERLKLRDGGDLPAEAMADLQLGNGFLARHLIDTQYLARVTREYLGHVCDPDRVWVVPGRLTALLRWKWGLNDLLPDANYANPADEKNRKDHRHHAIDAFVVGMTDRATLQQVARASEEARGRVIDDMPEPWTGFRDELRTRLNAAVISLRPDHGEGGRLHEETAYGLVSDPEKEEGANLVYRKPFVGLNENEIDRIRDRDLRRLVQAHVAAAKQANGGSLSGGALKQALADFSRTDELYRNIRHVRLLKTESSDGLALIRDPRNGGIYKAVAMGENWCVDFYEQPGGEWMPVPITVFAANQPSGVEETVNRLRAERVLHPTARKIMRLHKGDFVKLDHQGVERVMRVVRISPSNNVLYLAEHHEAGDLQGRHKDADDPFRWFFCNMNQLLERKARRVTVDILGRVRDPGPPQ
jgi:CRISPR-associated endonuclease Csn1